MVSSDFDGIAPLVVLFDRMMTVKNLLHVSNYLTTLSRLKTKLLIISFNINKILVGTPIAIFSVSLKYYVRLGAVSAQV